MPKSIPKILAPASVKNTIPSQAGQNGNVLSTTGSALQWIANAAISALLSAITALSSPGIIVRGGASTAYARVLAAGSSKVTISNADGTAGNPTVDVAEGALTLSNMTGPLSAAKGGTGLTSLANAIAAMLPSQSGNASKYLTTDGSVLSWSTPSGGGAFSAASTYTPTNASTVRTIGDKTAEQLSIKDFGGKADLKSASGASVGAGSTALTATGASWTSADNGKLIRLPKAGTASTLRVQITDFIDATHVQLAEVADKAVTGGGGAFDPTGANTARTTSLTISAGSRTLTDTAATFTVADKGKFFDITGAYLPDHFTTMTYVDATHATLAVAAPSAISAATIWYGTDDSAAFNLMATSAKFGWVPFADYAIGATVSLGAGIAFKGQAGGPFIAGGARLMRMTAATTPMLRLNGDGARCEDLHFVDPNASPNGVVCFGADNGSSNVKMARLLNCRIEAQKFTELSRGIQLLGDGTHACFFNQFDGTEVHNAGTGIYFGQNANGNQGTSFRTYSCIVHWSFDAGLENTLVGGMFGASGDPKATCVKGRNGALHQNLTFNTETSSYGVVYDVNASCQAQFWRINACTNEGTGSYPVDPRGLLGDQLATVSEVYYTPLSQVANTASQHVQRLRFGTGGDFKTLSASGTKLVMYRFPGAFIPAGAINCLIRVYLTVHPGSDGIPVQASYLFGVARKQVSAGVIVTPYRADINPNFSAAVNAVYFGTGVASGGNYFLAVDASTTAWVSWDLVVEVEAMHSMSSIDRTTFDLYAGTLPDFSTASANEITDCVDLRPLNISQTKTSRLFEVTATPLSSVTANIGDEAIDVAGGRRYIKNTGNNTNTGWVVTGTQT